MVCSISTSTLNIENLDGIKSRHNRPGSILDKFKTQPLGFQGHKIKKIKLKSWRKLGNGGNPWCSGAKNEIIAMNRRIIQHPFKLLLTCLCLFFGKCFVLFLELLPWGCKFRPMYYPCKPIVCICKPGYCTLIAA